MFDLNKGDRVLGLSEIQQAELVFLGAVLPNSDAECSPKNHKMESKTPSEILEFLTGLVERLLNEATNPIVFKMSGGLDSRVLAYILKEVWNSHLEVHIICHPKLSETEDVDVLLAKKTLSELNLPCEVRVLKGTPDKYLNLTDGISEFTGIYGTEIFGGLMFDILPVVERLKEIPLDSYLELIHLNYRSHIEVVLRENILKNKTNFYCDIFSRSSKSTIYNSFKNSWLHPYIFRERSIAPFGHEDFINEINKYDKESLAEYNLYDQVFNVLPSKYRAIPLCSDYKRFREHPYPEPANSINAKSIINKGQKSLNNIQSSDYKRIVERMFSDSIPDKILNYFTAALYVLSKNER